MTPADVPHIADYDAGAWLVYDWDHGAYAISLHASAPEAARSAARQGYGKVAFWPFGSDLADAVKEWESPTRVTPPGSDQGAES